MATNVNIELVNVTTATASLSRDSREIVSSQKAYHELADIPVTDVDQLEQLHRNIEQLADIRSRMQFIMREVRYVMKL